MDLLSQLTYRDPRDHSRQNEFLIINKNVASYMTNLITFQQS